MPGLCGIKLQCWCLRLRGEEKKMDQEKSFALKSFVRTGTQCNCGDTVDILYLEVFVIVVACVCMCTLHVSVLTHSIWQRTCVYVCVCVCVLGAQSGVMPPLVLLL